MVFVFHWRRLLFVLCAVMSDRHGGIKGKPLHVMDVRHIGADKLPSRLDAVRGMLLRVPGALDRNPWRQSSPRAQRRGIREILICGREIPYFIRAIWMGAEVRGEEK